MGEVVKIMKEHKRGERRNHVGIVEPMDKRMGVTPQLPPVPKNFLVGLKARGVDAVDG